MDTQLFHILKSRYRQLGGFRLVREYARMGLVGPGIKTILSNPFSRQTYKKAYRGFVNGVEPLLVEKYNPLMRERKQYYDSQDLEHKRSQTIWFCWLQGLDVAPAIVKACYNSLKAHLPDREIVVIDNKNWNEYVELPEYLLKKWQEQIIPPAHFSDLLRLQLLIKYGGSWIDSTILCAGFEHTTSFLDADLFMFQYTRPEGGRWAGIGNWFISSCANNEVLVVLRDMLYACWKEYDVVLDFYVFHLFFTMLREVYPVEVAWMPYGYAANSLVLAQHWGEPFNQGKWERLTSKVSFHKLTYTIRKEVIGGVGNYYNYILGKYSG